MAKGKLTKDKQYHGRRETEKKTDNIMAQRKGHDIVYLFFTSPLAMILSVFC
jgi:hypothetical protein